VENSKSSEAKNGWQKLAKPFSFLEKHERILFFLFTIINLFYLFSNRYFHTLDGPQHLYNSNLIAELLKGNAVLSEYLAINKAPVGNWTGHLILAIFNSFLPATLALKIFLVIYYVGISYSFRYLIRTLNGRNTLVSFLIFPFTSHTLLLFGFYNYSFAVIPAFIFIALWFKHRKELATRNILILTGISILTYFSHAIVFSALLLIILSVSVFDFLNDLSTIRHFKPVFADSLKRAVKHLAIFLPAIILYSIYILKYVKPDIEPRFSYDFSSLLKFLYDLKILIGFHYPKESAITAYLFPVLIMLLIIAITARIVRFKKGSISRFLSENDAFLFTSIFFLILYFLVPEAMSVGHMSYRIGLFFFFFLIIWFSVQQISNIPGFFVFVIVIIFTLSLQSRRSKHFGDFNNQIKDFYTVVDPIEENSVVYAMNIETNWATHHYRFYPGIDKPLIIISNPQTHGSFPIVWSNNYPPIFMLGTGERDFVGASIYGREDRLAARPKRIIDYAVVYGIGEFLTKEAHTDNKRLVETFYDRIFTSPKGISVVYRFKHERFSQIRESFLANDEQVASLREKAKKENQSFENTLFDNILYQMHIEKLNE
jgi:hypothetical protein